MALAPPCPVIDDPAICGALRRRANRLYGIEEDSPRFPAVMPKSVDATNKGQLRQQHYVALEKTDGIHCVLLLCRIAGVPHACLFGRSGVIYRIKVPGVAAHYKGTLLEGELVAWKPPKAAVPAAASARNPPPAKRSRRASRWANRRLRFVVFEAVAVAGQDLRRLSFVERLNAARFLCAEEAGGCSLEEEDLRARAALGKLTIAHEEIWMDVKRPVALADVQRLLKENTQPCDGVVFVPNVEFKQCGRRWDVLKKKFSDTLDFVVSLERKVSGDVNLSVLYTCGSELQDVFQTLEYAGRDVRVVFKANSTAFKAYFKEVAAVLPPEGKHQEVCEFAVSRPQVLPEAPPRTVYNRTSRVQRSFGYVVHMRFERARPDKAYPNTYSTIVRTFQGMRESIGDVVAYAVGAEAKAVEQ